MKNSLLAFNLGLGFTISLLSIQKILGSAPPMIIVPDTGLIASETPPVFSPNKFGAYETTLHSPLTK